MRFPHRVARPLQVHVRRTDRHGHRLRADAPISARRRAMAGPYPAIGFAGRAAHRRHRAAVAARPSRRGGSRSRSCPSTAPARSPRSSSSSARRCSASHGSASSRGSSGARRPTRDRMRVVIATALLWFVPVMLGPPLLSSDIYSYAAEGDMVTKGHDPTTEGMFKLQFGEYISHVDPVWRVPLRRQPVRPGADGHRGRRGGRHRPHVGADDLAAAAHRRSARCCCRCGPSPTSPAATAFRHRWPSRSASPTRSPCCISSAAVTTTPSSWRCCVPASRSRDAGWFWLGVVFIALATAVKLPAAAGTRLSRLVPAGRRRRGRRTG